jgi:hypothetical protein
MHPRADYGQLAKQETVDGMVNIIAVRIGN